MKYEWRKQEKTQYGAKEEPALITVPACSYIAICGKGNPNLEDFSQRVGVLYSLSYQVKNCYKAVMSKDSSFEEQKDAPAAESWSDFTVFPLEGVWTSNNPANPLKKDSFEYTIMIRQPGFITKELYETALKIVTNKKPHPFLNEVFFTSIEEGLCVQMLHRGSYDTEPATFAVMEHFCKEKGCCRIDHYHREIYLSDPRKILPESRKTILRARIQTRAE